MKVDWMSQLESPLTELLGPQGPELLRGGCQLFEKYKSKFEEELFDADLRNHLLGGELDGTRENILDEMFGILRGATKQSTERNTENEVQQEKAGAQEQGTTASGNTEQKREIVTKEALDEPSNERLIEVKRKKPIGASTRPYRILKQVNKTQVSWIMTVEADVKPEDIAVVFKGDSCAVEILEDSSPIASVKRVITLQEMNRKDLDLTLVDAEFDEKTHQLTLKAPYVSVKAKKPSGN